jgi:hypothetical protein
VVTAYVSKWGHVGMWRSVVSGPTNVFIVLQMCKCGFGRLVWAHTSLDVAADAQSGSGLVLIPIYVLLPIGSGGVVGYVLDRRFAGHDAGG